MNLPACVVPGCAVPALHRFLGGYPDGRSLILTTSDGHEIRSCVGHAMQTIGWIDRLCAGLPDAPDRIRVQPLGALN